MGKIEYRAVIKLLTKHGKSVQNILKEMESVYGDSCLGRNMVYKWHSLFKQSRTSLEDDPLPRRSIEVTTPEIIRKVKKIILEDAKLKKKQHSEIVGLSDTTNFKILYDHLGMTKVSARWVSRMLTPHQKQRRMEFFRTFLELCNEDTDRLLSRIVTGDEI